jgi:hypothetical protein
VRQSGKLRSKLLGELRGRYLPERCTKQLCPQPPQRRGRQSPGRGGRFASCRPNTPSCKQIATKPAPASCRLVSTQACPASNRQSALRSGRRGCSRAEPCTGSANEAPFPALDSRRAASILLPQWARVHLIRSNTWSISSNATARSSCPPTTKEEQLHAEFLNPFFTALG